MDMLFIALLAAFGVGAGVLLGTGNSKGLIGAILPGIIGGLLLSVPAIREGDWIGTAVMTTAVFVGVVLAIFLPEKGRLKRFCREQTSLRVRLGYYKLGRNPGEDVNKK